MDFKNVTVFFKIITVKKYCWGLNAHVSEKSFFKSVDQDSFLTQKFEL